MIFLLTLAGCLINDDLYALRRLALRDGDGDGQSPEQGDCDDNDPMRYTGAPESCDGEDDNCNGTIDEEGTDGAFYFDLDGDGFGSTASLTTACAPPDADWVTQGEDCNDDDALSFPGAAELCDGTDQDCDGSIDEDPTDPSTFYLDADADGFGNPNATFVACDAPTGYVEDATDCDDADESSHPGGLEQCDEADNDCDGSVDEAPIAVGGGDWLPDTDNDGYGDPEGEPRCDEAPGYVNDDQDCDDADTSVHPGAEELCSDGVDNDCDGGPGPCVWPGQMEMADYPGIRGDKEFTQVSPDMALGDLDHDGSQELYLSGGNYPMTDGLFSAGGIGMWTALPSANTMFSSSTAILAGDTERDFTGIALDICDLNGDGVDDLLTTSLGRDYDGHTSAGAIHVIYGPYTLTNAIIHDVVDWTITGDRNTDLLGYNIACADDIDGDGLPDIITGYGNASEDDSLGSGVAHLITAKGTGTSTYASTYEARLETRDVELEGFGGAFLGTDYSGDGLADYIISAPGRQGYIFLFAGPVSGDLYHDDADMTFWSEEDASFPGTRMVDLGDANADGLPDLAISASQTSSGGAVYITWGSATLADVYLADAPTKLRADTRRGFGFSLDNIGDLNSDGHVDLGVGEYLIPAGDVTLFFGPFSDGGVRYQSAADVWIEGGATDNSYTFIRNIGDWNGDGAPELAIGSEMHDSFYNQDGIVYFIPGFGM